jgi:hypothetical protein
VVVSAETARSALDALQFMAQPNVSANAAFGYAWATLRTIAGIPDCPMPHRMGPPKPEHAAAFRQWSLGGDTLGAQS